MKNILMLKEGQTREARVVELVETFRQGTEEQRYELIAKISVDPQTWVEFIRHPERSGYETREGLYQNTLQAIYPDAMVHIQMFVLFLFKLTDPEIELLLRVTRDQNARHLHHEGHVAAVRFAGNVARRMMTMMQKMPPDERGIFVHRYHNLFITRSGPVGDNPNKMFKHLRGVFVNSFREDVARLEQEIKEWETLHAIVPEVEQ